MSTPAHVRTDILDALELDLVGPRSGHAPHARYAEEALPIAPAKWYLTGFLVPYDAPARSLPGLPRLWQDVERKAEGEGGDASRSEPPSEVDDVPSRERVAVDPQAAEGELPAELCGAAEAPGEGLRAGGPGGLRPRGVHPPPSRRPTPTSGSTPST
jgi:hypothetical protein